MAGLGLSVAAMAGELGPAGTWEVTLAAGISISHDYAGEQDLATVIGAHMIPHVGLVLSGPLGSGWFRGQPQLVLEPTVLVYRGDGSARYGGLAGLGRWLFTPPWPVTPYVELGGGVLGGTSRLLQTPCSVGFIIQGGAGVLVPLAAPAVLTLGYRYHHVSNGGLCPNYGVNSNMVVIGLGWVVD